MCLSLLLNCNFVTKCNESIHEIFCCDFFFKYRICFAQFGIFDVPNLDDDGGDSGGDSDFEAELAAITAGERTTKPKAQKPKAIPQSELDKLVAASLRDIGLLFYLSL